MTVDGTTRSTVMRSAGAVLHMAYDEHIGEAELQLQIERGAGPAHAGAALMCRGLARARARGARRAVAALEAATPACGIVLDALHTRVDRDVQRMHLHRAGSTVMVAVDLWPVSGPDHGTTSGSLDDHLRARTTAS